MRDSTIKFLVDLGIATIVAVLVWVLEDLFHAATPQDTFRILSDGFFVAGAMFLAMGGMTWTKNGGVMDGLGFTFKTVLARIRSDYETSRMTFAEYREEREKKASSPAPMVLAGLVHIVLAAVTLLIYQKLSA